MNQTFTQFLAANGLAVLCALLLCAPATANTSPRALGDHLLAHGNPDAAITEYKRFLFFHPDAADAAAVYADIGRAYRTQAHWSEAITAFQTAVLLAPDAETKSDYQLQLAVTRIAAQDYDLARLELIKVTLRTPSALHYRRALFLQAVAYLYQFRWTDARESLRNYTSDAKLDTLFQAALDTPQKSVRLARILSTLLPGAGQAYIGEWGQAVNALLLNGTLGFLTLDALLDGYYIDAGLWGAFIFWRYYRGNTFRAGAAAEAFNRHESQRAAAAILQRLQELVGTPYDSERR